MNPHNTQIISAEPIEPLIAMMPVGETKIPEPIMEPTTNEMPPRTVMLRSSLMPFFDGAKVDDTALSLCTRRLSETLCGVKFYLLVAVDIFSLDFDENSN